MVHDSTIYIYATHNVRVCELTCYEKVFVPWTIFLFIISFSGAGV